MARVLRMPGVAANATDAVLSEWLVDESGEFGAADPIATVETEKAAVDIEADAAGRVLKTLVPPGAQHGKPVVFPPEQAVRGIAHVDQIGRIRPDAAQDAEDELDEERRPHQALVDEVGQVVEMAHVVALELEAGAVGLAQRAQDVRDVLEGVAEDLVLHALDVGLFPVVLPVADAAGDRMDREVHGTHVQRAHFRTGRQRIRQALGQAHPMENLDEFGRRQDGFAPDAR